MKGACHKKPKEALLKTKLLGQNRTRPLPPHSRHLDLFYLLKIFVASPTLLYAVLLRVCSISNPTRHYAKCCVFCACCPCRAKARLRPPRPKCTKILGKSTYWNNYRTHPSIYYQNPTQKSVGFNKKPPRILTKGRRAGYSGKNRLFNRLNKRLNRKGEFVWQQ